jgi:hypothetical protein
MSEDADLAFDFDTPQAWRMTIRLEGIEPEIWRTLLVPASFSFAQLHEIIQAAFGWKDCHLHQFILGGLVVSAPEFDEIGGVIDAESVRISDLYLHPLIERRFLYEYDFGDSWIHWVVLERTVPMVKGDTYPQLVDGARACPPEDCGGPPGYARFLEAWHDPGHEEHKDVRRWAGRAFNPEAFDIEKTDKAIRAALRRCKGGYRFRLET